MLREWMTAFWLRIKALLHRRQLERDLEDELQFHRALLEERLTALGTLHSRTAGGEGGSDGGAAV